MEEPKTLFTGAVEMDASFYYMLHGAHSLIAGATGSGKSTALDTLLYYMCHHAPTNYAFAIIDLKRISLINWKNVPHCLAYAETPTEAKILIKVFCTNLESRFQEMKKTGKRMFDGTKLFLIIDEAADLIATCPDIMSDLIHIMRLGRASNISVIYATQDPSKKTISAQIQQNCENLLALRCRDGIASRQIIGIKGAETLPKYGKALFYCPSIMEVQMATINKIPDDELQAYIDRIIKECPRQKHIDNLQALNQRKKTKWDNPAFVKFFKVLYFFFG